MIDLEKHIKSNRRLLDADTPREGHEERFLLKLQDRPVRRIHIRHILQVAASVAVILASAIVLINHDRSGSKKAMQEVQPTILEAEVYYTSQINSRYDQIREFNFSDSEEKALLLDELKDLDAYHQQLMTDLEANPDDERVINALIRHYHLKLEVMDQIITQLNQIKTETIEKDEKESV
jgi:hypothetical protein